MTSFLNILDSIKERQSIRTYSFIQSMLLVGPLMILLLAFYLYPLIALFPESFIKDGQFTWEHYRHFFGHPLYSLTLLRTIRVAVIVTLVCFFTGYPVAYALAELKNQKVCNILMICVLLPFFTSILVRSYAWIVLFQTKGIINNFLLSIGLIKKPLTLLHNEFAVLVGMIHILLPFMILPVFSVLKNIDRNLPKAARNLGASALKAFFKVTFPLSLPGVGAGIIFVFILSLGFYITPALLGGAKTLMISTLIDQQINVLIKWQFAGAIAVVLLVTTVLIIAIADKAVGIDKVYKEYS